jgi:hypothetical protein
MSFREKYPKKKYPFSDAICDFMDSNPPFHDSLKLANTTSFTFLPIILTSFLPDNHPLHSDEVLGFFYYDKKKGLFKQDFVVNKSNTGKVFYSYVDKKTKSKNSSCSFVCLIDDFFTTYGSGGKYYHRDHTKPWMHHYEEFDDLPENPYLRKYARDTILSESKQ